MTAASVSRTTVETSAGPRPSGWVATPGPRRFAFLVFLGALLMQAAWIVAVPPFRGSDEFDHAYRAASVADGAWMPTTPAPTAGETSSPSRRRSWRPRSPSA